MKQSEKLCDEIELIDEKFIEEAEQAVRHDSPSRKRRIVLRRVLVAAVIIAAVGVIGTIVAAAVANEIHHDKTYVSPEGETVELDFQGTEDMPNGSFVEKYSDQEGNKYSFDEEDRNTFYIMSPEKYKEHLYRYQNGEYDSIEEEKADEIASAALSSKYGEYFDDMILVDADFDENEGSWRLYYAQMLGEGGFIEGINCFAEILADGSIGYLGLHGVPEFVGIGDDQLKEITLESIIEDIEQSLKYNYRDAFVSFEIDRIRLRTQNGYYWVNVCILPTFQPAGIGPECGEMQFGYYFDK